MIYKLLALWFFFMGILLVYSIWTWYLEWIDSLKDRKKNIK